MGTGAMSTRTQEMQQLKQIMESNTEMKAGKHWMAEESENVKKKWIEKKEEEKKEGNRKKFETKKKKENLNRKISEKIEKVIKNLAAVNVKFDLVEKPIKILPIAESFKWGTTYISKSTIEAPFVMENQLGECIRYNFSAEANGKATTDKSYHLEIFLRGDLADIWLHSQKPNVLILWHNKCTSVSIWWEVL